MLLNNNNPFQVNNCGKSFGCFRSPANCDGTNCVVIITYALAPNMSDYLDVSMHTTLQWVALGHNSQPVMVSKSTVELSNYMSKISLKRTCHSAFD